MKLRELHEDYTDRYKRFTEQHFKMAYDAVSREMVDMSEIREIAKEFEESEEYGRTQSSAIFLLTRMHILIHGYAPHGITERSAEQMFIPSKPMEDFVKQLGYDVDSNIEQARHDMQVRKEVEEKRKELVATAPNKVFKYYKQHKQKFKNVPLNKYKLIDLVSNGMPVEKAFAQFT